MAGLGEVLSHDESDPDFYPEIQEPTRFENFKALFTVCLNLDAGEKVPPDSVFYAYQEYLKDDPNGQASAQAIRKVRADPQNANLVALGIFYLSSSEPEGRPVFQRLIDLTASHLPAGLGAEILFDPHIRDQAA